MSADPSDSANKNTWMSFLKSIATFTGDLSTLTAPSFILSGTSILEYSSYWGEHPNLFCDIIKAENPETRMLAVVKWYTSTLKGTFSARHESTGGEKKPLNPVLGETFHGSWSSTAGVTRLTAEQVSHHPPISAYHISSPDGVVLQGYNGQKSGFNGRTITVKQVGHATLSVPLKDGTSEVYLITLPQLSLEGLFFGSPYAELIDKSYVVSTTGWTAMHEYSGKGWLSGKKNTVKTSIFPPQATPGTDDPEYVVEGQWIEKLTLRRKGSSVHEEVFVDCTNLPRTPISHEAKDEIYESRRLWQGVASALKAQDYETASRLKSEIEQAQRTLRSSEKAEGTVWKRKYFSYSEELSPSISELMSRVGITPSKGSWTYIS